MANRDVNLVLRARDEATKAFESLADAMKQLQEVQKGVASGALSTKTALGGFAQAISEIQKQIKSDSIGGRLQKEMTGAKQAVDSLKSSVEQTRQAQAAFADQAAKASAKAKEEAVAADQLSTSLKSQRQLLKELNREKAKADRAATRPTQNIGFSTPAAASAGVFLGEGISELKQGIEETTRSLNEYRNSSKNAARDADTLASRAEGAGQSLERQKVALGEAERALTELEDQSKQARQALDQLAATSDRNLTAAIGRQVRAVQEAKAAYESNTTEVAQAARRYRETGAALAEITKRQGENAQATLEARLAHEQAGLALEKLKQRGNEAKNSYLAQREGLQRMRDASRETATDLDTLAARQDRVIAAQQRANASAAQATARTQALSTSTQQAQQRVTAAAGAVDRNAAALKRLATGAAGAAGSVQTLDQAFRQFYGGSRQALSLLQRLRGQFLGLTAGITGFYAAVNQVGQVINAIQTIDATVSRLTAVNDGSLPKISADLDFIRRTANRLGVEFGVLANQYSLFAAATRGSAIEGDTRGIFLALVESARVNKLPLEQLEGALKALGQIASKGSVQMEELRGQLGDRLPGALQIMADGLGMSTAEMIKLMEQGQLSSDSLSNFARELNSRFGGSLENALNTSTTALGAFQNAVFQAQLEFAKAGFEDGFRDLLFAATEFLQSAEFKTALGSLSQATASFMKIIEAAFENFQLIITALTAAIALRFAPIVIVASRGVMNFGLALAGTATPSMGAFNKSVVLTTAGVRAFGTATTAATVKTTVFGTALKSVLISTGIGAIFVAAATALAFFATQASKAGEASVRLSKNVDTLRDSYEKGARSASDFAKSLDEVSSAQASADLRTLNKELRSFTNEAANKSLLSLQNLWEVPVTASGDLLALREQLVRLAAEFSVGERNAQEFNDGLDALRDSFDENTAVGRASIRMVEDFAAGMSGFGPKIEEARQALAVYALKTGDFSQITEEAAQSVLKLGAANTDISGGFVEGQRKAQGFEAALREIREGVPELAAEMEKAKEMADLKAILNAEGLPETIEEIELRLKAVRLEIANLQNTVSPEQRALDPAGFAAFIAAREAEALKLEQLSESVRKRIAAIQAGKGASKKDDFADALKKLQDAIAGDEVANEIARMEGDNRKLEAVLRERQQFVDDLIADLPAGTSPEKVQRLRELGAAYVALGNDIYSIEQTDAAKAAIEELNGAISEASLEMADLMDGTDTAAGRLAAHRREQDAFLAQLLNGVDQSVLTPEQLGRLDQLSAAYRNATDAVFDWNEAKEAEKAMMEAAEKDQERLNNLIERRTGLQTLLNAQLSRGDFAGADQTRAQISALDEALKSAQISAVTFWNNLLLTGTDEQAELARQKLWEINQAMQGIGETAQGTSVTLGQLYEVIASQGADAFIGFLENVANGENVFKSLGQALQQFVSQTLIQIGKLIIQALILQGVLAGMEALFPGSSQLIIAGARLGNATAGVAHTGKKGGASAPASRSVPAAAFLGAPRFHNGRMGIKSGEMPAIIERTEDVVADDNPFHSKNLNKTVAGLSGGGRGDVKLKNVNVFDASEMLSEALSTSVGEEVLINWFRKNKTDINNSLES